MGHTARVICGGWVVFFATFALAALLDPTESVLLPVLCGAVAAIIATPMLHTVMRARSAGEASET